MPLVYRYRLGLMMVDRDLHLQGRLEHFRSNFSLKGQDQYRLVAGPRGITAVTDVPI